MSTWTNHVGILDAKVTQVCCGVPTWTSHVAIVICMRSTMSSMFVFMNYWCLVCRMHETYRELRPVLTWNVHIGSVKRMRCMIVLEHANFNKHCRGVLDTWGHQGVPTWITHIWGVEHHRWAWALGYPNMNSQCRSSYMHKITRGIKVSRLEPLT